MERGKDLETKKQYAEKYGPFIGAVMYKISRI